MGCVKSQLWDYIHFFIFFLWLKGNQAQRSAVNNQWRLRGKWSGTAVSDMCTNSHVLFYKGFSAQWRALHMSDYYTNSHTPAELTFGHHLLHLSAYNSRKSWNNQPDSHLDLSIPSFRSSLIPLLPLNHPLRLFALSICLSLALILSLSPFSVCLEHTHFSCWEHFGFVCQEPPKKIFHIFMQGRHSSPLFLYLCLSLLPPLYLPFIFTHFSYKKRPRVPLNRQFVPKKQGQASMSLFRQADFFGIWLVCSYCFVFVLLLINK